MMTPNCPKCSTPARFETSSTSRVDGGRGPLIAEAFSSALSLNTTVTVQYFECPSCEHRFSTTTRREGTPLPWWVYVAIGVGALLCFAYAFRGLVKFH